MVLPSDTCQTHAVTSTASDLTFTSSSTQKQTYLFTVEQLSIVLLKNRELLVVMQCFVLHVPTLPLKRTCQNRRHKLDVKVTLSEKAGLFYFFPTIHSSLEPSSASNDIRLEIKAWGPQWHVFKLNNTKNLIAFLNHASKHWFPLHCCQPRSAPRTKPVCRFEAIVSALYFSR